LLQHCVSGVLLLDVVVSVISGEKWNFVTLSNYHIEHFSEATLH